MESERILENVQTVSKHMKTGLEKLQAEFPEAILDIRGLGLMLGIQFPTDPATIVAKLRESGLLCPAAGGNVIRLLPPLTVTIAEADRALEVLRAVLAKL
jgi:4-aminobutyrate aminotransferase-like enzyme